MAYRLSMAVVSIDARLGSFNQAREVLVPVYGGDQLEVAYAAIDRAPVASSLPRSQLAQTRRLAPFQRLHVRRSELLAEFAQLPYCVEQRAMLLPGLHRQ